MPEQITYITNNDNSKIKGIAEDLCKYRFDDTNDQRMDNDATSLFLIKKQRKRYGKQHKYMNITYLTLNYGNIKYSKEYYSSFSLPLVLHFNHYITALWLTSNKTIKEIGKRNLIATANAIMSKCSIRFKDILASYKSNKFLEPQYNQIYSFIFSSEISFVESIPQSEDQIEPISPYSDYSKYNNIVKIRREHKVLFSIENKSKNLSEKSTNILIVASIFFMDMIIYAWLNSLEIAIGAFVLAIWGICKKKDNILKLKLSRWIYLCIRNIMLSFYRYIR